MPGPNDYHLTASGELEPGLGKDELSEAQRAALTSKGAAKMLQLKQELELAGAQLTEQQRELALKEEQQIKRERELEARERRLAEREEELAAAGAALDTDSTD